jgi:YD repeat-containing protein
VRYGYDALNRISRIHHGNGVETSYTYDGDGNVLLSFAYRYDGNGNRTAKTGTQVTLGGIIEEKIENEK